MRVKRPTRNDVARRAGVSGATVSLVLNERMDIPIAPGTRQRVKQAARELGYKHNHLARALVTGRTHLITLFIPYLHRPYYANALYHLRQQSNRHHYDMVIRELGYEEEAHAEDQQQHHWPVEGVFVFDGAWLNLSIDPFMAQGIPVVSMGVSLFENTDHVAIDLGAGARQAMEHLLEVGCRRIAYATLYFANPKDMRQVAYEMAMEEAHLSPEYIHLSRTGRDGAWEGIMAYMQSHPRPDAIYCHNDDVAIGAYAALCDLGIRIPEETAIVGCDGIEDTLYHRPALSTIAMPMEEMCRLAWEFFEKRMREPDIPIQRAVLPTHLEIRGSSRR